MKTMRKKAIVHARLLVTFASPIRASSVINFPRSYFFFSGLLKMSQRGSAVFQSFGELLLLCIASFLSWRAGYTQLGSDELLPTIKEES